MDERDLDDLLHEARTAPRPAAPAALTDRVLAAALAEQEARHPARRSVAARPDMAQRGSLAGIWQAMLGAIGGGRALAGLSTAALAGLWLGLAAPAPVAALTESVWPAQSQLDLVELLPDDIDFLEEG
ncbi:dihydroorotate dehydrogenase [Szabonella alba]|uniref:Dihydroorotate dehydrogenase n=1 Tax=Szabonella alba TaxID=2804194 RepID=A0A8K0V8Q2_9RHOB|nr:dihydroorotate dehydrogenase [Szabonella alba]MBL4916371.1 dihydroorotate dehydrogenase [Szabonella alba]